VKEQNGELTGPNDTDIFLAIFAHFPLKEMIFRIKWLWRNERMKIKYCP
jgi:hypothetical protein